MKYLTIDGMFSGTGIRDAINGGYIQPNGLGLSAQLANKISKWLIEYETAHCSGYADESIVEQLDAEGVDICTMLLSELPESKIEYYSSAKMQRVCY